MSKKFNRILVLVLAVILMTSLLAGCSQPQNKETAKEESQKEEKKVWVVGTSADYPPFESVDEKTGEFIGFDMDLIREVGKRLGVEVEIKDMPFDSLIASLKQGKIDAIIACMSPTPERLKEADFTDAYYETKQSILIKPGSGVEIKELNDILKYEFAVQTGTTMDEWATQKIKEGVIKENQLKRYTDANAAALDLKNGRLDAFLVDLPVAYDKAEELGLEVAIDCSLEGDEDPGILLPKGSDEMVAKLNKIIKEMKEDGFIKQLEDKWMK